MKIADEYFDRLEERDSRHKIPKVKQSEEVYKYNGIEFPTEQEMYEYMNDKDNTVEKKKEPKVEKKRYIVFTFVNGSRYYMADKKPGYTFNMADAKLMTATEANTRIHYANMNGSHTWQRVAIK